MKNVLLWTLGFLLMAIFTPVLRAQKVPDAQRYKMLNTYQKATAILNEINNTIKPQLCAADKACAAKADEFNKLAVQLQAEQAEAAKAMGLPEGTRFNISPATDEVTPAPTEKKPEAKKPVPEKK